MISQSSKFLRLYDFNQFIPAFYGQLFLFWSKLQRFLYIGGFSFSVDLVQVSTLFCFSVNLFPVTSPGNLSLCRGTLFLLSYFPEHAACDVNPGEKFSQTICHHKTGTWSTWGVFIDKHYHPYSWFIKINRPFLKRKKLINSSSHGWSFLFGHSISDIK